MLRSFLLYEVLRRQIDCLLGLLSCGKPLIYGTFPALYLLFAGLPGLINPRIQPNPNNIKLILCHILNFTQKSQISQNFASR